MSDFVDHIANSYAVLPAVEAVALGGSRSGPFAEPASDYDFYVYLSRPLDLSARISIARAHSLQAEIDHQFWEPGDEWMESSGERVDVMFRETSWMEEQLARVLDRHEASIGYTTAFWFNLRNSRTLFDRNGWFTRLQEKARRVYPERLRRNIVAKNHPILRNMQSSYVYQIEKALQRRDAISVNHRVAALLASFFDILFALNHQPHPGEKRLLVWSVELCPLRPVGMEALIPAIVAAAGEGSTELLLRIRQLLDQLDELLRNEKLL